MGIFTVDVEITRPGRGARWVLIEKVMVDTGSEATWLPEEELRSLGIGLFKRNQPFIMANGQLIARDLGIAIIRCGEFKTVDEVVFAKPGDLLLLGARTIEGFNARVDSRRKKLVPAGPLPAARSILY